MSNPDASAGPYAGNEKKPIGGNIMAHASTTRYVITHPPSPWHSEYRWIVCNSKKREVTHVLARFMIRLAFPNLKPILQFWRLVLAILKKKRRSGHALVNSHWFKGHLSQWNSKLYYKQTVNFIYNCMPLKAMTRLYLKTNPKCYYIRSSHPSVSGFFFENLSEESSKDVRVGWTDSFF